MKKFYVLVLFILLLVPFSAHTQVFFSGGAIMSFLTLPNIWDGYQNLKYACSCESAFGSPWNEPRQFGDNGKPLKSEKGTPDWGACQINTTAHKKELKTLGFDVIHSFDDNVAYAKILYDRNGLKDWSASRGCWGLAIMDYY